MREKVEAIVKVRLDIEGLIRQLAVLMPELGLDVDKLLEDMTNNSPMSGNPPRFGEYMKDSMVEFKCSSEEVDLIRYIQDLRAFVREGAELDVAEFTRLQNKLPAPLVAEMSMLISEVYSQGAINAINATKFAIQQGFGFAL